jgi:hypothetical protein
MCWKLENAAWSACPQGGGGAAKHKDCNNSIGLKILNEFHRELSHKTECVITLADICRIHAQYNVEKLSNLWTHKTLQNMNYSQTL